MKDMKANAPLSAALILLAASCPAVTFDVDVDGVSPVTIQAYHGESFEIAARFPAGVQVSSARFLWMTNAAAGGDLFATNAAVSAGGVVRTLFTGAMDAGAPSVPFFFSAETRAGTSYRAAGTIRFHPSPGHRPDTSAFPPPAKAVDFAELAVANAPWPTREAVEALVRDATNAIPAPPPAPDLSPYATKEEVASEIAAATNAIPAPPPAPDLAPYCTVEAARAMDAAVSNALAAAVASIRVPSLDGYATEAWVAGALAALPAPDLSPYATKEYADAAASNAVAGVNVPSLDGYATETYVDAKVSAVPVPDLSPYATKAYADAAAADAAAGVQVPSLEGYATQGYVDGKVAAIPAPDLSPYATKAYADAAAADAAAGVQVPSLEGYATKLDVAAVAAKLADAGRAERLWSPDGRTATDATGVVWSVSWAAATNWVSLTNGIVYRPTAPGVWIGDGVITNGEGAVGVGRIEYGRGMPEWFAFGLDGGGSYSDAGAEGLYLDYSDAVAMRPDAFTGVVERAALYVPMARVVTNDVGYVANGLATASPGDYLNVSNRAMNAVQKSGRFVDVGEDSFISWGPGSGRLLTVYDYGWMFRGDNGAVAYLRVTSGEKTVAFLDDIPDVSVYATQEDVSTAADSAVATANAYTDGQTTPLWSYLGAESFRVVVTNYDSAVHPPVASFEYRMTTNEAFRTVWNETNGLNRAIATATNLAHQAAKKLVDDPANRAWGKYDSETGEASPEGVIQATAPGGLIVGGGQRWSQISAESGWWILTSTDPTLCRTGTNGVFSIIGSDGEEALRVVKGDRLTVPAPASGIAKTPGHVSVTYSVVSDAHPTAEFGRSPCGPWLRDGDEGSPVSFSWSGGSGAWQLDFDVSGGDDANGFVRATYETGGDSYTAFGGGGVELGRIRVGGIPYTAGVSQVDGKTVLTLTPTDR